MTSSPAQRVQEYHLLGPPRHSASLLFAGRSQGLVVRRYQHEREWTQMPWSTNFAHQLPQLCHVRLHLLPGTCAARSEGSDGAGRQSPLRRDFLGGCLVRSKGFWFRIKRTYVNNVRCKEGSCFCLVSPLGHDRIISGRRTPQLLSSDEHTDGVSATNGGIRVNRRLRTITCIRSCAILLPLP